jgi:hypothetical protein
MDSDAFRKSNCNAKHPVLLKTFNFLRLRAGIFAGLSSLSTSCEATDNPVRASIECNYDVASVNAVLGQAVQDGC